MPDDQSINGHASKRAALYIRVSTDEQAKSGYSLADQRRALDHMADALGYEVVEVLVDDGYSGTTPDRPGLLRLLELSESGAIDVALAITRDRYWRSSLYRKLMDRDLQGFGVKAVARNDLESEGVAGRIGNAFLDEYAEYELDVIKERTSKGKMQKAREGKVLAHTHANYGFKYTEDRDGYEINETTMTVVRRIFRMLGAEGASINAVRNALEADGVPTARGAAAWCNRTIKKIAEQDVYKAHTHAELTALVDEGLLTPGVLAALDPERVYGVWWYNRHRDARDRLKGGGRTSSEKPRNEWVTVPVVDAGIPREWVDAARRTLSYNARPVRKDERVYELAGGVLYCTCGRRMVTKAKTRKTATGRTRRYFYYCTRRDAEACPNTKMHRAGTLERRIAGMVSDLLEDPAPLLRSIQERIDAERRKLRNPDKEARNLAAEIKDLDVERRGYQRQNAKGLIEDHELAVELDRIRAERAAAVAALEAAEHRRGHIEQLERDAALVLYLWASGVAAGFSDLPAAERRDFYRRARVRAVMGADGAPEISADLSSPSLLPDADSARDMLKSRVRLDQEDLHAWLNSRVVGTEGGDVYSVPVGVYRAYKELSRGAKKNGTVVPSKGSTIQRASPSPARAPPSSPKTP